MIADQKVRQQVLDIAESFIVQAPAGSGKTTLLVQRYLTILASGSVEPEQILAITFTRKAAAELRSRVVTALQLGTKPVAPDNEHEFKIWQIAQQVLKFDRQAGWDLIDNPARLKIQTIDALCSSIAGQMPITAQFGAVPQIEENAEELYNLAIDQLLQQTSVTDPWLSDLNAILLHLDNDRGKAKKLLLNMLQVREQWLPLIYYKNDAAGLRDILQASLDQELDIILEDINHNMPSYVNFPASTYAECIELANLLLTKDGSWRRTVTEQQGFPAPSKAKNKQEREQLKANKDAMLEILNKLQDADIFRKNLLAIVKYPNTPYSQAQWQIIQALFGLLPILVAQLTLVFKEQGKVDFCAVMLAALHALDAQDTPTDLALALDCKLQHILVDEFQDTSLSQILMLEKLTVNWQPGDGRTLFLVGDPMQSIYRFRKAEVNLFLQVKEHGINKIQLKYAKLSQNFRSTGQIVNWVNRVFGQSFPPQDDFNLGAISYLPSIAANSSAIPEQDSSVKCELIEPTDETEKIIAILQETNDQQQKQTIAVLVRAKSHARTLLPKLRAANIKFNAVDLESLSQRPLIQDLQSLTKALMHLDDRIAWFAILRAPWCGLLLEDLTKLVVVTQTVWSCLQDPNILAAMSLDGQQRVQRFILVMQDALLQYGRLPIDVLVQKLWRDLGGEQCLTDPGQIIEASRYFDLLASCAQRREFFNLGYLEQQLDNLYLQSTESDPYAVQIMTMHKAKGLEFDVVILPSLGKTTKTDEHKLLLLQQRTQPNQALLLAPIKSAMEDYDPIYKYLAWCEQQRQEYETQRLLYVAATRARKQIYCLGNISAQGPAANSLLAKIWPALSNDFQNIAPAKQIANLEQRRTIRRLPTEWYANNKYLPTELKTVQDRILDNQADWLRIVGIVVHRAFWQIAQRGIEHWPADYITKFQAVWQNQLRQLGVNNLHLERALQLVVAAIKNTIADPIGNLILSAQHPESFAEWNLTIYENLEARQIILDRAFVDTDGVFWIVDYKTVNNPDDISDAVLKYTPQLLMYIKAVRGLRQIKKLRAGFYFPLQARWESIMP